MQEVLSNPLAIFLILAIPGILLYMWWNKRENARSNGVSFARTPILDTYAVDFTKMAREKHLDPIIGRKDEVDRITQILSRKTKNNPMLLGEAGVGKSAIVEGLAERIVSGEVPESLRTKRVLALNVSALIAGTKYRGEFEQRLRKMVEEIERAHRQIILFIDEIHLLVQAKGSEGAMDPADILKPALARGDLQAIGATTVEEFEKYIKPEETLERRFQPVMVAEPLVDAAIDILKGIRIAYENHHRVRYSDAVMEAAVKLAKKYIKERYLPDKAIDVIDEAGAMVRLHIINDKKVVAGNSKKEIWPPVTVKDVIHVVALWTGLKETSIHV